MRIGRARAAMALALVAALLFAGGASPAQAATRLERRMHSRVNTTRVSRDLTRLRLGHRATRKAHRHSRRMARAGTLYHSDLSALLRSCGCRGVGENVGVGSSLDQVHKAFMASAPHRSNILGRWRRAGVGVVRARGRVWITEIFFL